MFLDNRELTIDSQDDIALYGKYIQNLSNMTLDSNESMFFARNLLQMEAKIYQQKYSPLQAVSLFPVDVSGGSGLESLGYRKHSSFGQAKWAGQEDTKPNKTGGKNEEVLEPVKSLETSYEFNFMDIRKANRAGVNLSEDGLMAAQRAINTFLDDKSWFGDSTVKIKGVFDSVYKAAYNTVVFPADGAGASAKITSKTYDLAVRDMKAFLSRARIVSKDVWEQNMCIMSIAIFEHLRALEKTNTDRTALETLQMLYPNIKFMGIAKLDGTATAGKDYIMSYVNSPEVISLKIPNPFEQLPTDMSAKLYTTTCIAETSSAQVKYADAITLVEN